jgi:hypothetical protein
MIRQNVFGDIEEDDARKIEKLLHAVLTKNDDGLINLLKKELIDGIENADYETLDVGMLIAFAFEPKTAIKLLNSVLRKNTEARTQYIRSMVSNGPLEYKDVSNLAVSYMKSKPAKPHNEKAALLKSLYVLLLKDTGLDVKLSPYHIDIEPRRSVINWLKMFVLPDLTVKVYTSVQGVQHLNSLWLRVQHFPNINFEPVTVGTVNGAQVQRPALAISGSLQEIKKALKKIVLELKRMPPAQ